jgi:hypothetical protein
VAHWPHDGQGQWPFLVPCSAYIGATAMVATAPHGRGTGWGGVGPREGRRGAGSADGLQGQRLQALCMEEHGHDWR